MRPSARGKETAELETKLEEAQERTMQKRQVTQAVPGPKGKTANHRRAIQKMAEEGDQGVAEEVKQQILSPGKIQKQLEMIRAVIADGGKDDKGHTVLDVGKVEQAAAKFGYKAILHGEEDIIRLLRRHHAGEVIAQRRMVAVAAVAAEEEVAIKQKNSHHRISCPNLHKFSHGGFLLIA